MSVLVSGKNGAEHLVYSFAFEFFNIFTGDFTPSGCQVYLQLPNNFE